MKISHLEGAHFVTKPYLLWPIIVAISCVAVPIVRHFTPTSSYIVTCVTIVLAVSAALVKKFYFYNDSFERYYPLLFWKRIYSYSDLTAVEIRNIRAPYQQPYVILHFSTSDMKKLLFEHRSFIYKEFSQLSTLIELFQKNNVKIIYNVDSQ